MCRQGTTGVSRDMAGSASRTSIARLSARLPVANRETVRAPHGNWPELNQRWPWSNGEALTSHHLRAQMCGHHARPNSSKKLILLRGATLNSVSGMDAIEGSTRATELGVGNSTQDW